MYNFMDKAFTVNELDAERTINLLTDNGRAYRVATVTLRERTRYNLKIDLALNLGQ
jgi:hypothetical protein